MHEIFSLPSISNFWPLSNDMWGMCLPKGSLYHYTSSVLAVKNILSDGELWMSKSTVMNDFSEITYGLKLVKKLINQKTYGDKGLLNKIEKLIRTVSNEYSDYFILSFSQNGNSRLLWDSYSHKNGYNIEFSKDIIHEFLLGGRCYQEEKEINSQTVFIEKGPNIKIKTLKEGSFEHEAYANSVLYDRKKQEQILSEFIDYIQKKEQEKPLDDVDVNIVLLALMQTLPFFKDPSLRDEEEYRLVIRIYPPSKYNSKGKKEYLKNIQCYREMDNMLFPYIILKMESREFIKSVSLGYTNCNQFSESTMRDFISTLSEDIKIKKPKISLRR